MISSYGDDGIGHRVASDLSCIAVAHELGLRFMWKPWAQLQHTHNRREVRELQRFFGFYADHPQITPHMRMVPRMPLPWVGRCHWHGWLDVVAANRTRCEADGVTVYDADNCWDRFWCKTIFTGALQAVLPPARARLQLRLPRTPVMEPDLIHVALHVRAGDAGYRRLPGNYYWTVAKAIAARHARFVEERGAGTRLAMKFWVHTNSKQTVPKEVEGHPVEVVLAKGFFRSGQGLQESLSLMLQADILVMSISSLSDVVALLGGMVAVYPRCHSEHQPLPGWHVVSCEPEKVSLDDICWPPTRRSANGRSREPMAPGGCRNNHTPSPVREWTFVEMPQPAPPPQPTMLQWIMWPPAVFVLLVLGLISWLRCIWR